MDSVIEDVRGLTMVGDGGLRFTVEQAVGHAMSGGALVECGTWKGGCSIAMLLAQRQAFGKIHAPVHMLDSFAGLPSATKQDGPAAKAWQADTKSPKYYDNCKASRSGVEAELAKRDLTEYAVIWEGWFDQTLDAFTEQVQDIALLRIDCDWYGPVKLCLNKLVPLVRIGGTVIIDDYYAWDGCTKALHEFLHVNGLPYRIMSLPDRSAAYFIKTAK